MLRTKERRDSPGQTGSGPVMSDDSLTHMPVMTWGRPPRCKGVPAGSARLRGVMGGGGAEEVGVNILTILEME